MKTMYNEESAKKMDEQELIIALEEMAQSIEILELELVNRGECQVTEWPIEAV
jgi:hypothetical protein